MKLHADENEDGVKDEGKNRGKGKGMGKGKLHNGRRLNSTAIVEAPTPKE
jgi:hypothetical protein